MRQARARRLFFALATAVAGRQAAAQAPAPIGVATMRPDGTIVLDLRAGGGGGPVGEARILYPPGHPQYEMILRHLGGLRPGETRPVPPFP